MVEEHTEAFKVPKYLQEVELTQENKEFIETLPSDSFWKWRTIHQYNGLWHSTKFIQGILNCQKYYKAHDSDVVLATLPKCGRTWLQALTFAIVHRKIHDPNSDIDKNHSNHHPLLSSNPHDLVPSLELKLYLHKSIPDLSSLSSPRIFATHMPYISLPESVKKSKCKIVYICRNPNDMFTSLWHFGKKLNPQAPELQSVEVTFEKFCEGKVGDGPFWDHILGYYQQSLERPNKVMFLTYEELKSEPVRVLKDLTEFLGYGFTKEEEDANVVNDILKLCSFENLSNLEVNRILLTGVESNVFFRRGEVGDSENFLTPQMIEKLDVITQEKLVKHGVNFQIHKS